MRPMLTAASSCRGSADLHVLERALILSQHKGLAVDVDHDLFPHVVP